MAEIIIGHLGLVELVLGLSQGQPILVLGVTKLLGQLLVLESEIADLGQVSFACGIELFLKQL